MKSATMASIMAGSVTGARVPDAIPTPPGSRPHRCRRGTLAGLWRIGQVYRREHSTLARGRDRYMADMSPSGPRVASDLILPPRTVRCRIAGVFVDLPRRGVERYFVE